MKSDYNTYMLRCLDLAQLGLGNTDSNPLVGAVLVYDNKIIGEGYHQYFGRPHAEVNAINDAIQKGNHHLIEKSTLFVNLEPCSHFGKTPPCSDLIIQHKIPHVVIGMSDPFPEVNGKGITRLREAGIQVEEDILREKCEYLNRRFITFHTKRRPFVLLKFAQTANHFMAELNPSRMKISNETTDVLVHKWRSEESAIMVGSRTAEIDNPMLTVRKWKGKNPIRITLDRNMRLRKDLHIFDSAAKTIVFTDKEEQSEEMVEYVKIDFREKAPLQILKALYDRKILSLMLEGGPGLLKHFIHDKLWDEARIITSDDYWKEGLPSPDISGKLFFQSKITGDSIATLHPFE